MPHFLAMYIVFCANVCISIHMERVMRTNIVLDDQLITEALKLSGKETKKDVVNFALQYLVRSLKKESLKRNDFLARYIEHPIELDSFIPVNRDDIYER